MNKSYDELAKLQPSDFLNTDNFVTSFDAQNQKNESRDDKQYQHGLDTGKEFDYVSISRTSVWSAGMYAGFKHCSSYEGIGYHANTKALLQGFIDSGCEIRVYREWLNSPEVIKPNTK